MTTSSRLDIGSSAQVLAEAQQSRVLTIVHPLRHRQKDDFLHVFQSIAE
ncbi:hypothetical protein K3495_g13362 [Podosphaera aphanis]|nr:hypothetical protein K3495_g13362 [Podosphaera aphanis]